MLQRETSEVLICGGAPLNKEELSILSEWRQKVIYLNGAIRLRFTRKTSEGSSLAISDNRFISSNKDILKGAKEILILTFKDIYEASSNKLFFADHKTCLYRNIGSCGLSDEKGKAFHGHTVLHFALQHCFLMNFSRIHIIGVRIDPPLAYNRSDGTTGIPEYVYPQQVSSLHLCSEYAKKQNISIRVYGKYSTASLYLNTPI